MRTLEIRIAELTATLERKEKFVQRLSDQLGPLREKLQKLLNKQTQEVKHDESK